MCLSLQMWLKTDRFVFEVFFYRKRTVYSNKYTYLEH